MHSFKFWCLFLINYNFVICCNCTFVCSFYIYLVALQQMANAMFLEGKPLEMLMDLQRFEKVGFLMAMSLIQGGPSPNVLDTWCFKVIASKKPLSPSDFQPSPDFLEQDHIKKVLKLNVFFIGILSNRV